MENQDTPPEKDWSISKIMRWGLGAIALLYLLFFILLETGLFKHYASQEIAAFGDAFGSINSLFSALAFLVIAASLYLQNREFRLQREELELQRQEFKTAREEQASSQEAQRKEMQLTRELHVRSNFEGRLMFLLKNLERVIQETKGEFLGLEKSSVRRKTRKGIEYFDDLHLAFSYLTCEEFDDPDVLHEPDPTTDALLRYYGLKDVRRQYIERHEDQKPENYSIDVLTDIHSITQYDYYHANTTFLMVIDALQKEYDAWIEDGFGTPEEINRHFTSYIYLFKSSMPHSAFVYFMYVRALPNGKIPYSPVHKMLVGRLSTSDFLHKKHMDTLLVQPEETPSK